MKKKESEEKKKELKKMYLRSITGDTKLFLIYHECNRILVCMFLQKNEFG